METQSVSQEPFLADFFDSAVQSESPHRELLQYLRQFSSYWQSFTKPQRQAEEMALVVSHS